MFILSFKKSQFWKWLVLQKVNSVVILVSAWLSNYNLSSQKPSDYCKWIGLKKWSHILSLHLEKMKENLGLFLNFKSFECPERKKNRKSRILTFENSRTTGTGRDVHFRPIRRWVSLTHRKISTCTKSDEKWVEIHPRSGLSFLTNSAFFGGIPAPGQSQHPAGKGFVGKKNPQTVSIQEGPRIKKHTLKTKKVGRKTKQWYHQRLAFVYPEVKDHNTYLIALNIVSSLLFNFGSFCPKVTLHT